MTRRITMVALAVALTAAAAGQAADAAGAASPAAGSGALIPAEIDSVSCPSAGNCSAGGYAANRSGSVEAALVVSEKSGVWAVSKTVARGTGPDAAAGTNSVSCSSAGNCGAGGYYSAGNDTYAFVIGERNGRWGPTLQVPGLARFNRAENADIGYMSCPAPGDCSAAGTYTDRHGQSQVFIVGEARGRWGRAQVLAGLARPTRNGASINSLSCASRGSCSAGGQYGPGDDLQAFVVSERGGVWGPAIAVRGLAALNTGRLAEVNAVSCASAGSCSAGGDYSVGKDQVGYAFVVDESRGVWGTAQPVRGVRRLGADAEIAAVACAAAGNCSAGGFYETNGNYAFAVSERNGVWGTAERIPGLVRLGGNDQIYSVSCGSPGNCSVGGVYGSTGCCFETAFVATERHGIWGRAEQVPGLAKSGADEVDSISCSPAGDCAAGGSYTIDNTPPVISPAHAFVVNERHGIWGTAQTVRT